MNIQNSLGKRTSEASLENNINLKRPRSIPTKEVGKAIYGQLKIDPYAIMKLGEEKFARNIGISKELLVAEIQELFQYNGSSKWENLSKFYTDCLNMSEPPTEGETLLYLSQIINYRLALIIRMVAHELLTELQKKVSPTDQLTLVPLPLTKDQSKNWQQVLNKLPPIVIRNTTSKYHKFIAALFNNRDNDQLLHDSIPLNLNGERYSPTTATRAIKALFGSTVKGQTLSPSRTLSKMEIKMKSLPDTFFKPKKIAALDGICADIKKVFYERCRRYLELHRAPPAPRIIYGPIPPAAPRILYRPSPLAVPNYFGNKYPLSEEEHQICLKLERRLEHLEMPEALVMLSDSENDQ